MRYSSLLSLSFMVVPLLPMARAWAQALGERPVLNADGSPDYATQDRYNFSDDQTGIRAGPFELYPSVSESAAYDSNVYASPAPRKESPVSITEALLDLATDPGGLLYLDGEAYARGRRFTSSSDQNTNEYGGAASFDAEASSKDQLSGSVLIQHRFEARTDIETPDIREVSLYDQWLGNFSYVHTYDRLQMNYTLTAQSFDYDDPSQKYRDRSFYEGEVSGTYQLPSALALLGTVYHSENDYRFDNPAVAGSETTGARVGGHITLTDVAEFELTAGYFRNNFDQHLGDIAGLSLVGSLILYPTELTTIRANVSRQDQPTRIPGAYGKVRTDSMLEIGHAYSQTLNLYARARVVLDDFATLRRTDTTYLGELGAFYEVSRGFVIGVEYDLSERSSAVESSSFLQHLVGVSFAVRL